MDQGPSKGCREHLRRKYFTQQKAGSCVDKTTPIFPNIVYKCLFTFKGGYAIEIFIDVDLALNDTNLRSILLHVSLILIKVL